MYKREWAELPGFEWFPLATLRREFGRWRVNNLVAERQEAVPFDPDFTRSVRQLGRRPSLQTVAENIVKKYGTHFLISATLGGKNGRGWGGGGGDNNTFTHTHTREHTLGGSSEAGSPILAMPRWGGVEGAGLLWGAMPTLCWLLHITT